MNDLFNILETAGGTLATIAMVIGIVCGWVLHIHNEHPGSNKQHDNE